MPPFDVLFVSALAVFAVIVVTYLAFRPRPRPPVSLRTEPRRDFNIRDGLAPGDLHPRWRDHEAYPAHTLIRLSARDLERVNIKRKLSDRRPLTLGGFTHGLAAAPPSQSSNDLLMWLLIFESVQPSHYSHRCSVDSGITVQPTEPFNGLGGSYGGAGASGSWDVTPERQTFTVPDGFVAVRDAEGRATGEVVPTNPIPDRDPPGYMPPSDTGYKSVEPEHVTDTGPAAAPTPDPTPSSYTPSPSVDSSPSYSSPSFDSAPSVSVDTSSL